MSEWGRSTYGDPCRQCGFHWTISLEEAVATVGTTGAELTTALRGADGSERHGDLGWSVVGYVCHVSDNLHIWAERLVGRASGDSRRVARYDQDLLARARRYDEIALAGALWSLDRAARDWAERCRSGGRRRRHPRSPRSRPAVSSRRRPVQRPRRLAPLHGYPSLAPARDRLQTRKSSSAALFALPQATAWGPNLSPRRSRAGTGGGTGRRWTIMAPTMATSNRRW